MKPRTAIALLAIVASMTLPGCGVFRPVFLTVSNTDQTGRDAPALQSTDWLLPGELTARNRAGQVYGERKQWKLLVFFDPL